MPQSLQQKERSKIGLKDHFYLEENPNYTILNSAADSVRFALSCLEPCGRHWRAISSFVNTEGEPQPWHDFGTLEGPGWAANAVGGAHELYLFGHFIGDESIKEKALGLLQHVLDCDFCQDDGLIIGYRETDTDQKVLNFKHNNEWFCPGSMARIAYQMLQWCDALLDDRLCRTLEERALWCATWIAQRVPRLDNGWFPRRVTRSGAPYPYRAESHHLDPIFDRSGDGIQILQLWIELAARDLIGTTGTIAQLVTTFINSGGFFGSVNHDTYDISENVSYAIAFRTLLRAADLLNDPKVRRFAYDVCLAGLDRFKMTENRNGVATKGLLYMEDSWNTAYLWENAEAASAYLDAFADTGNESFLKDAVTILRAIAQHHYGHKGFLTEGVDWDNVVGAEHHIDGTPYGAIRYTEPLLNNLHHVEAALHYFHHWCVKRKGSDGVVELYDHENNFLGRLKKADYLDPL
ncbi:MAG: hypothetical protein NZ959_11175 [Armatimonadetes bacterium]|nr:hypothetical protein [Armatimonadota bacterium]MDW8122528.1 hypothetical protein [Armatimonadota bacterium]